MYQPNESKRAPAADRLVGLMAQLKAVESYMDMLYSMALDLDSIPEFRLVLGYQAARRGAGFLVQGVRTAFGALHRLNRGELGALWTLALAGQMIKQALDLLESYLEVSTGKVSPEYQPLFNSQTQGFAALLPAWRQIADRIKDVVGLPMWRAAKTSVETILIPAQV